MAGLTAVRLALLRRARALSRPVVARELETAVAPLLPRLARARLLVARNEVKVFAAEQILVDSALEGRERTQDDAIELLRQLIGDDGLGSPKEYGLHSLLRGRQRPCVSFTSEAVGKTRNRRRGGG